MPWYPNGSSHLDCRSFGAWISYTNQARGSPLPVINLKLNCLEKSGANWETFFHPLRAVDGGHAAPATFWSFFLSPIVKDSLSVLSLLIAPGCNNSMCDRIKSVPRDGMYGRASLPASRLCCVRHLLPRTGRQAEFASARASPSGYCPVQPINEN
jgi:hypothetical protein